MDTHVRPNGSVLLLQPVMGPTIGPMACWTSVFFQIGERFSPPAHYGSSSWNNGLVGKLVIPSWKRFSPPAHYGSNSWTNGLLDKLVFPNLGTVESSSPQWVQQLDQWRPMACWTSLFFPVGSGLILQPTMGPTAGPMVCWTSLIFQIRSGLVLQPAMGPAAGPMASPLWVL